MIKTFMLNGKPENIVSVSTVARLLSEKAINPEHVVVEINGTIISRDTFDTCMIGDNDTVEILRFVGGG